MPFNGSLQEGIPGDFLIRQDGIKSFLIEVVKPDVMSVSLQRSHSGLGNGQIEALYVRMCDDY
jgi:hypothetical protein